MNCLHIAEELSRFENGAFSVDSIPGTIDRMEITAQKILYDSLFLGFFHLSRFRNKRAEYCFRTIGKNPNKQVGR